MQSTVRSKGRAPQIKLEIKAKSRRLFLYFCVCCLPVSSVIHVSSGRFLLGVLPGEPPEENELLTTWDNARRNHKKMTTNKVMNNECTLLSKSIVTDLQKLFACEVFLGPNSRIKNLLAHQQSNTILFDFGQLRVGEISQPVHFWKERTLGWRGLVF